MLNTGWKLGNKIFTFTAVYFYFLSHAQVPKVVAFTFSTFNSTYAHFSTDLVLVG